MIRVVLFDLGLTLVDSQDRPFPHVKEALQAVRSFKTADGKPLGIGLVSDFDLPAPPPTKKKIDAIFDRYLAILDQTGLRPFFEPVRRHVTLSTHVGVYKPDRKIFEMALKRLGSKAS
jgi:FMN phosphatase YigB (HAD superfamily)